MMTKFAANERTRDRLNLWRRRLERDSTHVTTPLVLVSVCHDETNLGQVVVSISENMPLESVRAVLLKAAALLAEGQAEGDVAVS